MRKALWEEVGTQPSPEVWEVRMGMRREKWAFQSEGAPMGISLAHGGGGLWRWSVGESQITKVF